MHLLCGEVSVAAGEGVAEEAERRVSDESFLSVEVEILKADQKRLNEEVDRLQTLVRHMAAELGISLDGISPPQS
jgi:hypothetical protein